MKKYFVIVSPENEFYNSNINEFTKDIEQATKYSIDDKGKEVSDRLKKLPEGLYEIRKMYKV